MSDVRRDIRTGESPGEEASHLQLDDFSRHRDVTHDTFRGMAHNEESDDNGLKELMQLLRRTPPPENRMSIPDNFSTSSSEDDRWKRFKIKILRKRRKPRKPRPPTIKLPDSALAAKTIDGHRHIAISIPIEYSYLNPLSPSQYPVFESMEPNFNREIDSRLGTVLGPVAEDRESSSSISLSPKASSFVERTTTALSAPPRRRQTVPHQEARYTPRKRRDSSKSREPGEARSRPRSEELSGGAVVSHGRDEYRYSAPGDLRLRGKEVTEQEPRNASDIVTQTIEVPRTRRSARSSKMPERTQSKTEPTITHDTTGKGHSRNPSDASTSSGILSSNRPIALSLPKRRSSKKAITGAEPGETIDNVISSRRSSRSDEGSTHENGPGGGLRPIIGNVPRGSLTDSLVTTESSPKLFKAQTATAYHTIPVVTQSPSRFSYDSPLNFDFPKPPVLKIDRAVQTVPPPPAPPAVERAQSWRERVWGKKHRDVERLIARFERVQTPPTLPPEIPIATAKAGASTPPRPTTAGKMKLDVPPVVGTPGPGTSPNFPQMPTSAFRGRLEEKAVELPPAKSPSSPSSQESLDPTSSRAFDPVFQQRWRERQAAKKEQEDQRLRDIARALAEQKETTDRLSRQELVHRYEALKEARMYEMERRMRRLERNSEIWLRSIAPMMETLNRLLQEQNRLQRAESSRHHGPVATSSNSLRPLRSFDSSLNTHPSQSMQDLLGKDHIGSSRPRSAEPLGREPRGAMRGGQLVNRPLSYPPRSALQEEFEKELTARRAHDQRVDEVDARMRKTVAAQAEQAQATIEGGAAAITVTESPDESSLEKLEPLMRELQAAAGVDTLGCGGAGVGIEGEGEGDTSSTDEGSQAFALF
ncbi:Uu.00g112230.m01.CDS01 [Anthostomella pinea]|uniref:Uu.00g112230.m01.CDS01 n=1 Tax=Anthostomella pinea TaxID=933095 RepID=A0AAI8VF71_9PEZI|nr:Uu.00g112230.m01.CDS01 [Anthostomella pinea]